MQANDTNAQPLGIAPRFVPAFRIRQWLMVAALCAGGLWLAKDNSPATATPFETISMVSAKADYYLESFTLLSTRPNGDADYTLSAKTLIHLPSEQLARVQSPSLTVNGDNGRWDLLAATGELPDDGQTVRLLGGVTLTQQADTDEALQLSTPNLLLDRHQMQLSSDAGVNVQGQGWQLRADKMTGLIEPGKLIFRDNNHVQYAPTQAPSP